VNDVVTVAVHQVQVVEGGVVVVLVVMMHFYHILCREAQSAECATTTLSLEQSRDPSRFAWVTSRPGPPIDPICHRPFGRAQGRLRGFCRPAL